MSDTNTKTNDEWKKRELGALWRVEGRNQSFYSGEIALSDGSKQKIVIFKNKFKECISSNVQKVFKSHFQSNILLLTSNYNLLCRCCEIYRSNWK